MMMVSQPAVNKATARIIGTCDAILIHPGLWHTIKATEPLRFLCCCAPPYSHEDTYFE
jgi:mannose-6-phosphate isomerase-like protein (cupin superfamily)